MMTTPNLVRKCIDRLVNNGGQYTESHNTLNADGTVPNSDIELWKELDGRIKLESDLSLSVLDFDGESVDLSECDDDVFSDTLRFHIRKETTLTSIRFFFANSLKSLFANEELLKNTRKVFVSESRCTFNTETCIFAPWERYGDPSLTPLSDEDTFNVAPRRYVRDLSGGKVPLSIGESLLVGEGNDDCPTFQVWCNEAKIKLLLTLVNEVWVEKNELKVLISGPRKVIASYTLNNHTGSFYTVTEIARWVYASGRDIDVRHTLFTYELAREFPENTDFSEVFCQYAPQALDIAKTSFSAHVKETSKDTLKSLGDLRKTLSEDVARITSQTRDFLTSMWRDFAFAVTVIVGRAGIAILKPDMANNGYVIALMSFTSIFLMVSCASTLFMNCRFMSIAKENRAAWRKKLYGFLGDEELKSLADKPIQESENLYKKTAAIGFFCYLCVSISVLILAFSSLDFRGRASIGNNPIVNITIKDISD